MQQIMHMQVVKVYVKQTCKNKIVQIIIYVRIITGCKEVHGHGISLLLSMVRLLAMRGV